MISGQLNVIVERQNEVERAAKEMYKGLHHEIGLLRVQQESEKVRVNFAWKDEMHDQMGYSRKNLTPI